MTISTSSLLCQFLIMIYVTILCLISFPLFTIFQDHMIHFHVFKYRIYACGVYICVCVYIYIYIYTHHIYGASLIAQLVKNLPAMQEILVPFLGREDLLEKG